MSQPKAKDTDLSGLPGLSRDDDGPVFNAPWEAQAFALTLALHESGAFTWAEWTAALSAEILRAQAADDPDLGDTYYRHWLNALEQLSKSKGLLSAGTIEALRENWTAAASATPHGEPIIRGRETWVR